MRLSRDRVAGLALLTAASATTACAPTTTTTRIREAEVAADVRAEMVKKRLVDPAPAPAGGEAEDKRLGEDQVTLPALRAFAVARQPSLDAAAHRVRALVEKARADGKLPPPELMADVWQVPFSKPYAIDKAGMIMFTLRQVFPPAGALDRMAQATAEEAQAEAKKGLAEAQALIREVDRAFVDYASATARHEAHDGHRAIVVQMIAVAKARYATGGALGDYTRAELELGRTDAELAREHGMIDEARARLNGLLLREADAPLGKPAWGEPRTVAISPAQSADLAAARNPEVGMAERMESAARLMAEAADREATVPMITAGVSTSMPTNGMHAGYGLSLGMSLPWAWGAASAKHKSAEQRALAGRAAASAARQRARAEASMALASVRSAERRYLILRDTVAPAAHRALEAARAGYAAGGTDLLMWLDAARAAREIDVDLGGARGDLERALSDLDRATGAEVPRVALRSAKEQHHGK